VEEKASEGYFKLPPLLDHTPVPDARHKPAPSSEDVSLTPPVFSEQGVDDFWLCESGEIKHVPEIKTWATFERRNEQEAPATFITEAGSAAFDALVAAEDDPLNIPDNDKYITIDTRAYCASLLTLALGRSSLLYTWDESKSCFSMSAERVKLQGYSGQTLKGVSDACKESGDLTRHLRAFADKIYGDRASPARTALANAVDKLLHTIQSELGARAERVGSVLQLQALVHPVRSVLVYFRGLVQRLSRSRSDEQLISLLFEEVHTVEYKSDFLRNTICEVLRAVSKPWTDFVEEWVGLKPETGIAITKNGPGKGFVKVENKLWVDDQGFELEEPDYFLDDENMPSFVPDDLAQEIFETGRNLRFIRTNHANHRLARFECVAASDPPKFEWQFDWEAVSRVERKAKEYEEALSCYLERSAAGTLGADHFHDEPPITEGGFDFQFFGKDQEQMADNMLKMFSQPMAQKAILQEDSLQHILRTQVFSPKLATTSPTSTSFNPHWSLLPLLSFGPVISAQARIVNKESMRLLFTAHNLRSHLRLQRQYHLLSNGLFVSRLSHALFDPELDTAERRSGVALTGGVMGLRLNGRENWPPASSELRLALMGVLAESYEPCHSTSQPALKAELLPDMDVSFAVRDLSAEEIERCMDPNSLYALDFLRLSYKPPSALLPVMTPIILLKYDRIFRLLLRVLRMLYVVHSLFREVVSRDCNADAASLQLRVEAHHFITRLAAYLFDTGIAGPWARFESWLDDVEGSLSTPENDSAQGRSHAGPDRLRDRHEATLDEIMDALLLRKRQKPVMRLLEDIFGVVLQFAKFWRRRRSRGDDDGEARRLLEVFGKKVDVFVSVCRRLSEKGDGNGGGGEDGGIGRLLLLLDMRPVFAHEH
jgi:hypothetical protein